MVFTDTMREMKDGRRAARDVRKRSIANSRHPAEMMLIFFGPVFWLAFVLLRVFPRFNAVT